MCDGVGAVGSREAEMRRRYKKRYAASKIRRGIFELHGNLIWATKVEKDSTPLLLTQDMKINAQHLIN